MGRRGRLQTRTSPKYNANVTPLPPMESSYFSRLLEELVDLMSDKEESVEFPYSLYHGIAPERRAKIREHILESALPELVKKLEPKARAHAIAAVRDEAKAEALRELEKLAPSKADVANGMNYVAEVESECRAQETLLFNQREQLQKKLPDEHKAVLAQFLLTALFAVFGLGLVYQSYGLGNLLMLCGVSFVIMAAVMNSVIYDRRSKKRQKVVHLEKESERFRHAGNMARNARLMDLKLAKTGTDFKNTLEMVKDESSALGLSPSLNPDDVYRIKSEVRIRIAEEDPESDFDRRLEAHKEETRKSEGESLSPKDEQRIRAEAVEVESEDGDSVLQRIHR